MTHWRKDDPPWESVNGRRAKGPWGRGRDQRGRDKADGNGGEKGLAKRGVRALDLVIDEKDKELMAIIENQPVAALRREQINLAVLKIQRMEKQGLKLKAETVDLIHRFLDMAVQKGEVPYQEALAVKRQVGSLGLEAMAKAQQALAVLMRDQESNYEQALDFCIATVLELYWMMRDGTVTAQQALETVYRRIAIACGVDERHLKAEKPRQQETGEMGQQAPESVGSTSDLIDIQIAQVKKAEIDPTGNKKAPNEGKIYENRPEIRLNATGNGLELDFTSIQPS